jgi:hypothetical protein
MGKIEKPSLFVTDDQKGAASARFKPVSILQTIEEETYRTKHPVMSRVKDLLGMSLTGK